jgi:hypothetical protein
MGARALSAPAAAPGQSSLERLAALARAAGLETVAREAQALAARLAEGRFYVACIGQFKRGKSTLLNALVGEAVLPAGVVPVTSVITVLRHGEERAALVRFGSHDWRAVDVSSLAAYVTEEHNPGNRKGVTGVEVFLPAPLLRSGMCLVDTPGLGSVFAGATAATRSFVPHLDAALVVLGGDPPISGEEMTVVEEVAREVDHIVPVFNKADRLSVRERQEVTAFTRRMLEQRLGRPMGPLPEVSATERLAGAGPTRDWAALVAALTALARGAGGELVEAAERRGLRLLADRVSNELAERRGALVRPVAESERRIAALRRTAEEAERSLGDLAYLLTSEQDRLSRALQERRESFLARARPAAQIELEERLRAAGGRRSALRDRALALAREIYDRWVDRWREEVEPASEALYREAAARFVELTDGFLGRLAASGDPVLAALPREAGPEMGFRVESRLYYTGLMHLTGRSPWRWLLDALRLPAAARRAVGREAGAYLDRLLVTNASRVAGDLEERVRDSRRRLEAETRRRLEDIYGAAERALAAVRTSRAEGAGAVEHELRRIDDLERELAAVLEES